jgi:hypothetical protein
MQFVLFVSYFRHLLLLAPLGSSWIISSCLPSLTLPGYQCLLSAQLLK